MFVTFPENIDTLKAEQSEALEALISGRDVIAILPIGFGKKPDFSIVLLDKARYESKYVHFSGCPAK